MSPSEAASLLGVRPDASLDEIQRAFVHEARLHHPDLHPGMSEQGLRIEAERFARLTEARQVLLERHPVLDVEFSPLPLRRRPRGIGGSVLILLLLAAFLVASVTVADTFRSQTVENLRGGVIETP